LKLTRRELKSILSLQLYSFDINSYTSSRYIWKQYLKVIYLINFSICALLKCLSPGDVIAVPSRWRVLNLLNLYSLYSSFP
jgi:hypothetical protein